MADAGLLSIKITADDAQLVAALARSRAAVKSTGDELRSGAAQFGKYAGAAAAAGVVAGAAFVAHTIKAIDAQNEMAQSLGITIQALNKFEFSGAQAGLSQEDLAANINKLNKTLGTASEKGGEQAAVFRQLGVSIDDANGKVRKVDEVVLDLADSFQALPDGVEKSRIAQELFGKSGAKMIPLLNQGSAALKEQGDAAAQLGLVISNETAAAANTFSDNLEVLSQVTKGTAISVANEMLPAMNRITSAMIEAAKEGGVLQAILVGIGGVAAEALHLNTDDINKADDDIKKIRLNISLMQDEIRGQADIGLNTTQTQKNLDDLQVKLEGAIKYRDRLANPPEVEKPFDIKFEMPDMKDAITQQNRIVEGYMEIIKASDEMRKQNKATVEALREQAATIGQTAAQVDAYKLKMNGATEAQIQAANAAHKTISAFEGLKEIGSIKIGAMEGNDQAVAQLQEKYLQLNKIIAANPELQQQAAEAASMLAVQYQHGIDAQIAAGQAANDAYLDQMGERVKLISKQNDTEMDIATQKYKDDAEALEEALLNRVITEQEYNDISMQQQAAHEDGMANMKLKSWKDLEKLSGLSWKTQASIVTGTLADMTAAMATKSRTMFEINKVAAASNAAVRIPGMMAGAFEAMVGIPYVGPVLAVAAAAAAGAFGAAQVAAIMSTSYGGGGGKGGAANVPSMSTSSVGQAGVPASAPAQTHTLSVQPIDDGALFSGKSVRLLAEKLIEYQRDGGKVVLAA